MAAAGAPSPRILVVRTSALGDIVHALPVLPELRRALPAARIGWVVDEAFAPLLDGHELIDEVLPAPLRRWRRSRTGENRPRELAGFVRRLRHFGADVALDLMGNHKGAVLARISGAAVRIGAERRARREPASAIWINRPVPLVGVHASERMLSLLGALAIAPGPVDFAPQALACGKDRVPTARYAYLHPGAAWGNKRYPPSSWGAVAAELRRRTGLDVWVGAGPGEEELALQVTAASGGAARTCDAESLSELVGVIRGARLVLAGDTGALHLARALAVPLVAVHGPTDPAQHGPYGAPTAVVERPLPCSYCHRRMPDAKACLLGISAAAVVERALSVLAPPAV